MFDIVTFTSLFLTVHSYLVIQRPNTSAHFQHASDFSKVHDCTACGEPLYLTPLLEQKLITRGQQLSRVKPALGGMRSHSGYFTVNKYCESNLFFWFFPAQKQWKKAPVILWLQGGPGVSSLYGLFEEVGPFKVKDRLSRRQYSWNVENNLLFIDQPVGTGYSFAGKGCYAENVDDVARDLYPAVVQFFELFPALKFNTFIIAGESYAGHYIPALANFIHENNKNTSVKVNLASLMIGDGWMDPMYQSKYGDYLYQLGLVDDSQKERIYESWETLKTLMNEEDWPEATNVLGLCEGQDYIGNVSYYNYLKNTETFDNARWITFVQNPETRQALHVGNTEFFGESILVFNYFIKDMLTTVKPLVQKLLEHYPIIFYHGQLDIICAYPMAVQLLRALQWSGSSMYLNATRNRWCVGDQQAGYYKSAHNLHEVLVRAAGHMVPRDQPLWAYVLANSIASGSSHLPLTGLDKCRDSSDY